ncbi:MAG: tetratricopeptide repeat protein [Lachnospiraceae bacterium]|nr:tetratricopeptide repeat protein [Lachnospiraceae bacterium]
MICPRCGERVPENRSYCESCGADLTAYRKIMRLSNSFYNKGLERARVRDLSGAVQFLKKSLGMNKRNTEARNLLGLVFFEMGETVAALGEWVVSKHFQPEDNRADDYMEQVQGNPAKLDAMNQAIKKYNMALESAKQGGDDLAILQLKKAVSLHPNFIRARQLLALLYLRAGERERAKKQLMFAAQKDVGSTTTLRYLQELAEPASEEHGEEEEEPAAAEGTVRISPESNYTEDKPNVMAWITLVVGALLGVLVSFFLIVPTARKNIRAEFDKQQLDYSSELRIKEAAITSLEKESELWQKKYEETARELAGIVIPEYDEHAYDTLFQALTTWHALSQQEEPGADELLALAAELGTVEPERLKNTDAAALYQKLRTQVYGQIAEPAYRTGRDFYSDKDYEQAVPYLQTAYDYGRRDDRCCYYLGRSYQGIKRYEEAAVYYRLLLEQYPESSFAGYAATRLEEMGMSGD